MSNGDEAGRWYGGVLVVVGAGGGRYPDGNSLVVTGRDHHVLVDPSLTVHGAGSPLPAAAVLVSHVHEDHVPGLDRHPELPVHVHRADHRALASFDGLMDAYGYEGDLRTDFGREILDAFHYRARPDATPFDDGATWDLGGRTVTALHLPGHTAGHCGFLVEPDGFFFLADVDLTGFGPYYGDATSDLEAFEATLRRCREVDARWYGTFHQKGVVEGRAAFLEALDRYAAVIDAREAALLGHLAQPLTLEELAARRMVYRPDVDLRFVDAVERRSAALHLARLARSGAVEEVEPGRWRRAA